MKRRDLLEKGLWLAALGLTLAAGPAPAARANDDDDDDDDDDHDRRRARIARESGQIMGLAELMTRVERRFVGRIVKVKLEQHDGRWTYEFSLLPPDGRVFKVHLDAATGELNRSEGRIQERPN